MEIGFPTDKLFSLIASANKIIIIGHFNPDGDAIGSTTGMYHYIKGLKKSANIISPNKIPEYLQFLDPKEEPILIYTQEPERCISEIVNADLIICQDFNKLSRTEFLAEHIKNSTAKKALIDHHPFPEEEYFDVVISTTNVSSTCELVFHTLMAMPNINGDSSKLSIECATSLYSGLLTDTNNFANSLFPNTLTAASALLARGVDAKSTYYTLFCPYTADRMRLMGKILLENMVILPEHRAAYILLSKEDKNRFNYKDGDSEGFVNLPLSIKDVDLTALLTEDTDFVRVSLRSKGDINVNSLAGQFFNGGGHINASGGRIFNIKWKDVPSYFENALNEWKKA